MSGVVYTVVLEHWRELYEYPEKCKGVYLFISVLVDCGTCFSRPHNLFGSVRNVEVNPPVVDGTPALHE